MASRKQNRAAYNAELRRIRAFIKRAEKRGFRFEKIPGLDTPIENPRKADIERLKSLNRYSLYKYATAVSAESGKVISGTQAVKEQRQASAQKAQRTRKTRLAKGNVTAVKGYEVVYENIKGLIVEFPTKGASYLNRLLQSEIRRYGRDAVLKSMMEASDELIGLAQSIIYYEDKKDNINRALRSFADIIQSHIRDQDEERELSEAMSDDMEDVDIQRNPEGFSGWMYEGKE